MTYYYRSQNLCRFTQPKLVCELLFFVDREVNYFYANKLTDDDDDDDDDDDEDDDNNNIFNARCN